MRKPYLVYIKWYDASHPTSGIWCNSDDIDDFVNADHSINSVGWIIRENNEVYILSSQTSFTNQMYAHIERIPKGVVKKIVKIGNVNKLCEWSEDSSQ